jgi:hypothetical protein
VFDVGAGGMLPQEADHGGRVYFEWDHMNQNTNWSGTSKSASENNADKKITTNWYVAGVDYMFNRDWGVMARLPYTGRTFVTEDNAGPVKSTDFGDMEIMGVYTGFTKTMSTGLLFGVKLPTGQYKAEGFDRDTQIGTGSTDLILGAFHRGMITGDNKWQYFGQVKWLTPVATRSTYNSEAGERQDYRPGSELDGAVGIVYNGGYKIAGFDKIAPVLQLIGSHRERDSGAAALPADTGYDRVLIAPGIEFTYVMDEKNNKVLKVYVDVEIPLYQRVNGQQLVAPELFKLIASYNF